MKHWDLARALGLAEASFNVHLEITGRRCSANCSSWATGKQGMGNGNGSNTILSGGWQ